MSDLSPNKLNLDAAREIVGDREASATALFSILLSVYGNELFGTDEEPPVDPVEIYAELEDRFRITLPEENENRIQAILLAVGTDGFYNDEVQFIAIAESLLDGDLGEVPTGNLEELSLIEMLWAVYEVAVNRGEHVPDFAPVIHARIAAIAADEAQDNDDPDLPADMQDIEYLRTRRQQVLDQLEAIWGPSPAFQTDIPDPIEFLRPIVE